MIGSEDLIASEESCAELRGPIGALITHRLPLDRVFDAIGIVSRGEGIKVTIEP